MIGKDKLKSYANKLMFDMNDSEYETLQQEFETIQKQMDLIGQIEEINGVEPMTFPYLKEGVTLREDSNPVNMDREDALKNCHGRKGTYVRVPRVVE